jgi:hypothetical protein
VQIAIVPADGMIFDGDKAEIAALLHVAVDLVSVVAQQIERGRTLMFLREDHDGFPIFAKAFFETFGNDIVVLTLANRRIYHVTCGERSIATIDILVLSSSKDRPSATTIATILDALGTAN